MGLSRRASCAADPAPAKQSCSAACAVLADSTCAAVRQGPAAAATAAAPTASVAAVLAGMYAHAAQMHLHPGSHLAEVPCDAVPCAAAYVAHSCCVLGLG